MYAIIRAGGKQAKVQSGDVIDIERVKGDSEQLTFAPLLVVDDKGNAVSDRGLLANASVTAKVLGESQGPKIDIFKYKNKTGYRRRQGHRQKYIRIEITGIELPGATKTKSPATKETEPKPPAAKATAAKSSAAKETAAKSPAAKSPAAKETEPKPTAAKATAAKTTAAKASAAKAPASKVTAAKTPAAKAPATKAAKPAKADSSEEE